MCVCWVLLEQEENEMGREEAFWDVNIAYKMCGCLSFHFYSQLAVFHLKQCVHI